LNTTDGTVSLGVITHHHDRESTGLTRCLVSGHGNVFKLPEGLEKTADGKLGDLVIKVPDIDFEQPFSHEATNLKPGENETLPAQSFWKEAVHERKAHSDGKYPENDLCRRTSTEYKGSQRTGKKVGKKRA